VVCSTRIRIDDGTSKKRRALGGGGGEEKDLRRDAQEIARGSTRFRNRIVDEAEGG